MRQLLHSAFLLRVLEGGNGGEAVRYFLLAMHYRHPIFPTVFTCTR